MEPEHIHVNLTVDTAEVQQAISDLTATMEQSVARFFLEADIRVAAALKDAYGPVAAAITTVQEAIDASAGRVDADLFLLARDAGNLLGSLQTLTQRAAERYAVLTFAPPEFGAEPSPDVDEGEQPGVEAE